MSLLAFAAAYGTSCAIAAAAGDVLLFVGDLRWLLPLGIVGVGSFVVSGVPQALERMWGNLWPWVANSEAGASELRAKTLGVVGGGFWVALAITIVATLPTIIADPTEVSFTRDFPRPQTMKYWHYIVMPFTWYFAACMAGLAVWGLPRLAVKMRRVLDLRSGFLLEGGKALFRPITRLLWMLWTLGLFPFLIGFGIEVAFATKRTDITAFEEQYLYSQLVLITVLAVLSVIVPYIFIGQLLGREKAQELTTLRNELKGVRQISEGADTGEVLRRMYRHQQIEHDLRQVETISPSLIEARFLIQIGISVSAILIANILIRLVLI